MDIPHLLLGALVVGVSFVVGGIPWGVIVAKLTGGPDPRTLGSGRTGGANVLRALGPRWALVSGLLDVGKGIAAVLLARVLGAGYEVEVLAALAAIVGHSRSVFLGFGGGRGIAPGFGGLIMLGPLVALVTLPVFAVVLAVWRYSSLGSLIASATAGILLAVVTAIEPKDPFTYVYAVGGTLLIWAFHADNIQRLILGQERKIGTPAEPRRDEAPGRGG